MNENIKEQSNEQIKLEINITRIISGVCSIVTGLIVYLYNRKHKNKKYISIASILTAIFGCTLIGTELEESFKPVDVEEVTDEDLDE